MFKRDLAEAIECLESAIKILRQHQGDEVIEDGGDEEPLNHLYNAQAHITEVTVTPIEYEQAVRSLRKNFLLIKPKTPIPTRVLRTDPCLPKMLTMKLPVLQDTQMGTAQCKACSDLIMESRYVPSLHCPKARVHVTCAAVLVDKLGMAHFSEHVCSLNHHKISGVPLKRRMDCLHKPPMGEVMHVLQETLQKF